MRVYRCQPSKIAAELERLAAADNIFFPRYGIKPIGYWTVLVGESNHDIYFILEWDSIDEWEQKWAVMFADPEWKELRAASEQDGVLLTSVKNMILKPVTFDHD